MTLIEYVNKYGSAAAMHLLGHLDIAERVDLESDLKVIDIVETEGVISFDQRSKENQAFLNEHNKATIVANILITENSKEELEPIEKYPYWKIKEKFTSSFTEFKNSVTEGLDIKESTFNTHEWCDMFIEHCDLNTNEYDGK